jgi:hypothetical protein
MKVRYILVILIVIGVLAMGMFGLFKKKTYNVVTYRLVWFELQVAPFSYRFAIMPEQPILIGYEGENGEKGATMLIRYDHVPAVYDRTVEKISDLVQKSGVMKLLPNDSHIAFANASMDKPSVHVRIAYSDERRWASYYEMDKIPKEVESLIQETKKLAKQLMIEQSNEKISGEKAHEHLMPNRNIAQKESPAVVAKIRVRLSGKILVNEQAVSLSELGTILDELKTKNGAVWYFRESPEKEPPESTNKIIQQVLEAVTSRKLPIQLQPEEY